MTERRGVSTTRMTPASKIALRFLLPAVILLLAGNGWAAAPLVLERTIPLAGVSGRIDHLAVDLGRKRLLVAELGNGTVDVVDLGSGKVVHRLSGLREPQGIGYAPQADIIAVANGGDGSVRLFRGEDFAPVAVLDLMDDADNVRLDAGSGQFVVGYGNGALALIDPVSRAVVRRANLPAHPEGIQLDPTTRRAFVNVPDARQIAVVDLAAGKQVATWQVPRLDGNFPMAWNPAAAMIATVFRDPARLVLLDGRTGAVRLDIATCGDADDLFFDAARQRIYVSCGAGSVDVFQHDADSYRLLSAIDTSPGARTSLFVPELDRLFVAARAGFFGFGSKATILVFRPQH